MLPRVRKIAIEMIAQQSNLFREKMIGLYTQLNQFRNGREAQASSVHDEMVATIMKFTGLKIDLIVNTTNQPCCMPVLANSSHVLNTFFIKDFYSEQTAIFEDAIKSSKIKKGFIDLKNGKLGGVYSEIESPVYMSFNFCKDSFTPAQCVAVLFHELGHCFLSFEFMYRTVRASQILAQLSQVRTGRDTSIKYEHALELAGVDLTGDPKEFVECVEMKNDTAVASVVFCKTFQKLANDLGDHSVTGPNFEVLADTFSSRWGGAADLAEALKKLYGSSGLGITNRFTGSLLYLAPVISSVIFGAYSVLYVGSTVAFPYVFALTMVISLLSAGRADGSVSQTNVYDKPFTRLLRLRESVVEQLKYLTMENRQRSELLDQIKSIDQLVKGGKDVSNVMDDISLIFESNRRAEYAFKLERHLEALANNNLFVSGQRLASRL